MEPGYKHRTVPCFEFLYEDETSEVWALTVYLNPHVFSVRIEDADNRADGRYKATIHRWGGQWRYAATIFVGAGNAKQQMARLRTQALKIAYSLSEGKVYKE
jgi:hypothetical protein